MGNRSRNNYSADILIYIFSIIETMVNPYRKNGRMERLFVLLAKFCEGIPNDTNLRYKIYIHRTAENVFPTSKQFNI